MMATELNMYKYKNKKKKRWEMHESKFASHRVEKRRLHYIVIYVLQIYIRFFKNVALQKDFKMFQYDDNNAKRLSGKEVILFSSIFIYLLLFT